MPTDNEPISIGIDVGGTHTRFAAVTTTGEVASWQQCETPHDDNGDALAEWIRAAFHCLANKMVFQSRDREGAVFTAPTAIGVALPGLIDRDRGGLVRSVSLPFLEGRDIAADVRGMTGTKPALFTDADAATWGEFAATSVRPRRFVHLRLGTGVALGAVINGAIHPIEPDRITHAKLLVVDDGATAEPCPCGLRGCLETVASGRAIETSARNSGFASGVSGLREALSAGDAKAVALVSDIAGAVCVALDRITAALEPESIVLGGGAIEHLPELFDAITRGWHRPSPVGRLDVWHRLPAGDSTANCDPGFQPVVIIAALGDRAGAVGAALLARR